VRQQGAGRYVEAKGLFDLRLDDAGQLSGPDGAGLG
jgi:hypothetical protein